MRIFREILEDFMVMLFAPGEEKASFTNKQILAFYIGLLLLLYVFIIAVSSGH